MSEGVTFLQVWKCHRRLKLALNSKVLGGHNNPKDTVVSLLTNNKNLALAIDSVDSFYFWNIDCDRFLYEFRTIPIN